MKMRTQKDGKVGKEKIVKGRTCTNLSLELKNAMELVLKSATKSKLHKLPGVWRRDAKINNLLLYSHFPDYHWQLRREGSRTCVGRIWFGDCGACGNQEMACLA